MRERDEERMTAGELHMVREYLGLTQEELAEYLQVADRTVRYWEIGRFLIPDGVRESVETLEAYTAKAVGDIVAALEKARDPRVVVYHTTSEMRAAQPGLPGYVSARWWRHVVARAVHEVPGVEVGTVDDFEA